MKGYIQARQAIQSSVTISAQLPSFPATVRITQDEMKLFVIKEFDSEGCYVATRFISSHWKCVMVVVQALYNWFYLPPLDAVSLPFEMYLTGDPYRELVEKIMQSHNMLVRFITLAAPEVPVVVTHSLGQKQDTLLLEDLLDTALENGWDFTGQLVQCLPDGRIVLETADGQVRLVSSETGS